VHVGTVVGPQHDDTMTHSLGTPPFLDVSAGVGQARRVGEAPRPALLKRDDVHVHRRVVVRKCQGASRPAPA
jgi:hypothetical protein